MNIRSAILDAGFSFSEKAAELFRHQRENNPVYGKFTDALGIGPDEMPELTKIPLLPIRAFREAEIVSSSGKPSLIFKSSGTSGMNRSTHKVFDEKLCVDSVINGFTHFYGKDFIIWAYTPGYSENPNSSLVWMLKTLMERAGQGSSRFLELGKPLNQMEIDRVVEAGKRIIVFGAAFGLIDLAEMSRVKLPDNSIVIETGGMKTHRKEIGRKELHRKLAGGFQVSTEQIHSEYGMCEMLSQAYSRDGGWFEPVPWLDVTIRDPEDPQRILDPGDEGLIGIVDLANIDSCSFLLTGDKGVGDLSGRFRVLGRWNPLDLRGCNFLIEVD